MSLFGTLKKLAVNGGKGGEIDDLKAIIGKRAGLARQNRFVVIMNSPASSLLNTDFQGMIGQALSGQIGLNDFINDPRDVALLCQSTQIPGRQFNTLEYNRDMYANQIKIPYTYTNEDVTFTFLLTNDYYMKKFFEDWMSKIYDFNNHMLEYKPTYTSDLTIQQLDPKNTVVYGVKLLDAYPTAVNSINLDNTQTDAYQTLNVTFTYTDVIREGTVDSIISGAKGLIGNFIGKNPVGGLALKLF